MYFYFFYSLGLPRTCCDVAAVDGNDAAGGLQRGGEVKECLCDVLAENSSSCSKLLRKYWSRSQSACFGAFLDELMSKSAVRTRSAFTAFARIPC